MAEEQAELMPVARVVAVGEPEAGAVEWKPVARTSGLATASMTLAIIASVLCVCHPFAAIMPAIPAVVCGHLGRRDCQRDALMDGRGYALAGLMMGYVCVGVAVLATVGWALSFVVIGIGMRRW